MQQRVADPVTVEEAAAILRGGGICAFATETVYGLGADATDPDAVLSVYEAKGRPRFNPLIVHCADFRMAEDLVVFDPVARRLAVLWPGPLTLVLPARAFPGEAETGSPSGNAPKQGPGAFERLGEAREYSRAFPGEAETGSPSGNAASRTGDHISDIVSAGLSTLAVRVPRHPQAQALIAAVGRPLAAPSANSSGKLSPTTAGHVRMAFGGRVPVLDGGPCAAGLESTIVAVRDGQAVQLRAGALPREEIAARTGVPVALADADAPVAAPGMLKSHYAPRARLRLEADTPRPGEAFLGFGAVGAGAGEGRLNLSPSGDLREAARNLFSYLRTLDAAGAGVIAIAPIPGAGLGEAINDRLRRAAAR